jgi:hypothetical protein
MDGNTSIVILGAISPKNLLTVNLYYVKIIQRETFET